MPTTFPVEIFLENDFTFFVGPLSVRNATTGVVTPLTGQGITCFISLTSTYNSSAINVLLSVTMTEDATIPGQYWGTFTGPNISTFLNALVDGSVWLIAKNSSGYRCVGKLNVRDPRSFQ